MTGWEYDALRRGSPRRDEGRGVRRDRGLGRPRGRLWLLIAAIPVVVVGAPVLLAPVLVFIGSTARVGARRREARLAAMRLVGATPGQVR